VEVEDNREEKNRKAEVSDELINKVAGKCEEKWERTGGI
jgi:hypothetical protein